MKAYLFYIYFISIFMIEINQNKDYYAIFSYHVGKQTYDY